MNEQNHNKRTFSAVALTLKSIVPWKSDLPQSAGLSQILKDLVLLLKLGLWLVRMSPFLDYIVINLTTYYPCFLVFTVYLLITIIPMTVTVQVIWFFPNHNFSRITAEKHITWTFNSLNMVLSRNFWKIVDWKEQIIWIVTIIGNNGRNYFTSLYIMADQLQAVKCMMALWFHLLYTSKSKKNTKRKSPVCWSCFLL